MTPSAPSRLRPLIGVVVVSSVRAFIPGVPGAVPQVAVPLSVRDQPPGVLVTNVYGVPFATVQYRLSSPLPAATVLAQGVPVLPGQATVKVWAVLLRLSRVTRSRWVAGSEPSALRGQSRLTVACSAAVQSRVPLTVLS